MVYSLAEHCKFTALKEELIQDRLIVGIRDTALSEHLQMDPSLTLEKAKKLISSKKQFGNTETFSEPQTPLETAFLAAVGADTENAWFNTVQLLGRPLSFKLDTGAEIIFSKRTFRTLPPVKLRPLNRTLHGPNEKPLSVLEQFQGTLSHNDQTSL